MTRGDELRDDGINRALDNEHEHWKVSYLKVSARWFERLPKGSIFHGEAMRLNAIHVGIGEPHHPNVWGAMASSFLKSLLNDELIEECEMIKASLPSSHSRRNPSYRKM